MFLIYPNKQTGCEKRNFHSLFYVLSGNKSGLTSQLICAKIFVNIMSFQQNEK